MKKITAVIVSLAVLVCFASCGGDTTEASSEGASSVTSTPVSSQTNITISIPTPPSDVSTPEEEESENLAMADGATGIDMNTGKVAGDEGYKTYYGEADGNPNGIAKAFDGDIGSGWQTNDKPDGTGTIWLGVEFAEAVSVDMIVLNFESGSAPAAYENGTYRVEYSVDGAEWIALDEAEVTRTTDSSVIDAISFTALEVKAIRVVFLAASEADNGKWSPKVWEFEIYAPVDAEETESTDETVAE